MKGYPVDVLLVGGEIRLAQWIANSKIVSTVYCVPSKPEFSQIIGAESADVPVEDITALLSFALLHRVDVAVFGSNDFLTPNVGDAFKKAKMGIIGPDEAANMLKARKNFPAKLFIMQQ